MDNEYLMYAKRVLLGQEQATPLREIRKKIYEQIPASKLAPNTWLSLFHLFKNVAGIVLCGFVMYFLLNLSGIYFVLGLVGCFLLSIFNGLLLYGLLSVMHDCIHGAFSKSQFLNNVVSFFTSFLFMFNFEKVKKIHLCHHKFVQSVYLDDEFKGSRGISKRERDRLKARNGFFEKILLKVPSKKLRILFMIIFNSIDKGTLRHIFADYTDISILTSSKRKSTRKEKIYSIFKLVTIFFVFVGLIVNFGFLFFLFFCFFSFIFLCGFTTLISFNHIFRESVYAINFENFDFMSINVSNIVMPVAVDFFGNYFHRYHLEHHVLPIVPCYRLKKINFLIESINLKRPKDIIFNEKMYRFFTFNIGIYEKNIYHVNNKCFSSNYLSEDFWSAQPEVTTSLWSESEYVIKE